MVILCNNRHGTEIDAQIRFEGADIELAERVDAFVGRSGRLQAGVDDKLLPALFAALGEPTGTAIDNLDWAERLGKLEPPNTWMAMRKPRNRMTREYVEDLAVSSDGLDIAHGYVPILISVASCLTDQAPKRGWPLSLRCRLRSEHSRDGGTACRGTGAGRAGGWKVELDWC